MDITLDPILRAWPFLLRAVGVTLLVAAGSALLGMAIGVVVGAGRTFGGRVLFVLLDLYVNSMRAIPVLVILIWAFFAFPILAGITVPPIIAAIAALGLHIGAYFAETVRAGLQSVRPGQRRAALALGMTPLQALRVVVLPQAVIRMLPNVGSLLTLTIKDTAIASVIAVPELMRQTQIVAGQSYRPFELYTFAMLVYFVMCLPLARGVDLLYRRLAHKGRS
jgi:His/Glu/Gln/Arg/opine family amino acid ABC transporter permease subunit